MRREKQAFRRRSAGTAQVSCAPSAEKRLVSWKEVARYLRCTIRTLERWESREGLPIHCHLDQKGSTVYAYASELDAWLTGSWLNMGGRSSCCCKVAASLRVPDSSFNFFRLSPATYSRQSRPLMLTLNKRGARA
jgi:hypothetical protein